MAELFALGAGIVAFIQLTDRVINLSKFYLEGLQDCPHEIRVILVEVSSLKAILQTLDFLIGTSGSASQLPGLFQQLCGQDGPVEACRKTIMSLEQLLPQDVGTDTRKRRKLEVLRSQLAWPLKQPQAKRLLDEIMRYKTSISFALTTETAENIRNIKAKLNEVQQIQTHEQRQDFCKWIEHTNPTRRHNDSCVLHEDHTGGWMIRSLEWQAWLQGSMRFLWIHGIPGAGKTVLLSFLIEQAKAACQNKQQVVVYYYCYFAQNQDEARPLLRWLIGQLCRNSSTVPSEIMELFRINHEPSLLQLLQALHSILQKFDAVYLMIDAVDESLPRDSLINVIRDLATDQQFQKIRLLATSREYLDIETTFSPISTAVSMVNELVTEDIRTYVHSTLQTHTRFANWPQDLLLDVEEALAKGAKGMFRWAFCQIDVIKRLRRQQHEDIRKAIRSLPKTLDETYERIFVSIQEDDCPFVKASISMICAFEDTQAAPITTDNLLKLVLHSLNSFTTDIEQQYFTLADLRDICGCLLTLSIDEEYEILNLAHYTVKEYLYSDRIAKGQASQFALSDSITRQMLAKTALDVTCQAERWDFKYYSDCPRSFGPLCESVVLNLLRVCETDALRDRQLRSLYYIFFSPSRPGWKNLTLQSWEENGAFVMIPFQRLPDDYEVAIFANLISAGLSCLAKKFLETQDTEKILLWSLIHTHSHSEDEAKESEDRVVGRSLVDFFREWREAHYGGGGSYNNDGRDCFSDIVKIMIEIYSPTLALLMYVGAHHYHSRTTECRIHEFLDRGADPNAVGYRITPLQIATCRLEISGVKELLEGGADANATGDTSATARTFSSRRILDMIPPNATPLGLIRNIDKRGIKTKGLHEKIKGRIAAIITLLRKYGATEGE